MKLFSNEDIENYYDQTEIHYRMHWKLEEGMGLHYGIWDENTKNIAQAVLNTNHQLMTLGEIKPGDHVLDAGCGIGGSSIYLAKNKGCTVHGITLSKKQVVTASNLAKDLGVNDKVSFSQQDYNSTNFPSNTFDIVWCIESMETATDKKILFREINRLLKPGGKLLIGDIFKPEPYNINDEPDMQVMLNGWAMSDILSISGLHETAAATGMVVDKLQNVTDKVLKSVQRMYLAGRAGGIGAKIYNFFFKSSQFSRLHYKTGIAQKKAYDNKKWGYYLVVCRKQ
ncbi:MAG: methyltransferase domain-containing protein [Taibaiella sp.]|nr:methyltransferase domain-containing protein [Taibaiella sp.]